MKKKRTKIFKNRETIELDDMEDTELLRRLRAWKKMKKEYEEAKFLAEISNTSVKLDENTVKIMILKLIQVEKLMKDMGKTATKFTGRVNETLEVVAQSSVPSSHAMKRVNSRKDI